MHWIERMSLKAGLAVALAVSASAATAQVLVVRSSGPSATKYRAGSALANNASVALRPGDVLVLLDGNGSWTLRGPGTMPVRTRQAAPAARLVSVNERRARIGAIRPVDGVAHSRPQLLLMVDVAKAGPTCLLGTTPTLWRADDKAAGKMTVAGPNGQSAEVEWAPGQQTRDWPSGLPVVSGGEYRLSGAGLSAPVQVTLKTLAEPPADEPGAGRALLAAGCTGQLDELVAKMEQKDQEAHSNAPSGS